MRHILPTVMAATVIAVPAGAAAWIATHAPAAAATQQRTTHAKATATARPKSTTKAHATLKKKVARAHPTATPRAVARVQATATALPQRVTITGPSVDMEWGPVQVTLVVQGKRVIDVQATAPIERARSQFINSQAVPWLRQETLQAQSANIDVISGATMTSEAFAQSLQGALQQAHLAS